MGEVAGLLARWLHLVSSVFLVGGAALLLLAGPLGPADGAPLGIVDPHRRPRARCCSPSAPPRSPSRLPDRAPRGPGGGGPGAGRARPLAAGDPWRPRLARPSRRCSSCSAPSSPCASTRVSAPTGARPAARPCCSAAVALGLLAAAGHAAAVEPGTAWAIAVDVVHLVAAGVWAAACLRWPAAARPGATRAPTPGRTPCSRAPLLAPGARLLVARSSGFGHPGTRSSHVGSVAGLVGTRYGRLLLVKARVFVAASRARRAEPPRCCPRSPARPRRSAGPPCGGSPLRHRRGRARAGPLGVVAALTRHAARRATSSPPGRSPSAHRSTRSTARPTPRAGADRQPGGGARASWPLLASLSCGGAAAVARGRLGVRGRRWPC